MLRFTMANVINVKINGSELFAFRLIECEMQDDQVILNTPLSFGEYVLKEFIMAK